MSQSCIHSRPLHTTPSTTARSPTLLLFWQSWTDVPPAAFRAPALFWEHSASRWVRASRIVAACHRSGWHHTEDLLQCQTSTSSASSWLPRATMRSIAAFSCSSSKYKTPFTFYGFIPCSRIGCVWGKMGHSVLFINYRLQLQSYFRLSTDVCMNII